MSESSPIAAPPPALPFVYPLDALYARAGLPLPRIQKISAEEMPEPYRALLAHSNDMTPTLEKFHRVTIHVKILHREQRDDAYFRQVTLMLDDTDKAVEFGAIKVSLALFPPKARQLILDEHLPLGSILKLCQITHSTFAKAFFRVEPDQLISSVLHLTTRTSLFGRRASIVDAQKRPLCEIVEILPP